MGYITDYNGRIVLSSNDIVEKLNKFIEDSNSQNFEEHFELEGIELEGERQDISICGGGKIYNEELENFCLFISQIDNKCFGEIECKGEESDDFWKIEINSGEVWIKQGYIEYDKKDSQRYNSNKMNKNIYEVTKDKKLLRELMIEGLEK